MGVLATGLDAATARPHLGGVRVLVVDDDLDAREVLATLLGAAGADVRTAPSTADALAELQAWWPAVLLSDIGMPGDDGYVLIRAVRALASALGSRLGTAAVTAHASSEDRVRALAAGFQAHVAKPVDPEDLIAVVAQLAQSSGAGSTRER